MPNVLQRSLLMPGKPPFAELHLQQEGTEAYKQAHRIATIRSQGEAERKVDDRTDDGLRDVVRQTHPAIVTQAIDRAAESSALIKPHERSYQHTGESQLLPHVKGRSGCLLHKSIAFHDQFFQ